MLRFVWDLEEIKFCCHLMKLSLILYFRFVIIEEMMIILIGTNHILSILLLSW
jgi:hypothetical protein